MGQRHQWRDGDADQADGEVAETHDRLEAGHENLADGSRADACRADELRRCADVQFDGVQVVAGPRRRGGRRHADPDVGRRQGSRGAAAIHHQRRDADDQGARGEAQGRAVGHARHQHHARVHRGLRHAAGDRSAAPAAAWVGRRHHLQSHRRHQVGGVLGCALEGAWRRGGARRIDAAGKGRGASAGDAAQARRDSAGVGEVPGPRLLGEVQRRPDRGRRSPAWSSACSRDGSNTRSTRARISSARRSWRRRSSRRWRTSTTPASRDSPFSQPRAWCGATLRIPGRTTASARRITKRWCR